MPANKVTQLLGIEHPILQGPFGGGFSTPQLVAAVSNAGGIGGYGAYTLTPNEIIEVNNRIKALTSKPYNLNLWVSDTDAIDGSVTNEQFKKAKELFRPYFDELNIPLPEQPPTFRSRFENQVQVILDLRPKLFSFVFGIPSADIIGQCKRKGIITAGTATTAEEAVVLADAGVDIIVASGFEAGGHRPSFLLPAEQSTIGTFVLVQLVREKVKLPVIAAGGIADGRGIRAAFHLGADAVQIGTAFLACEESGAPAIHKRILLEGGDKRSMLTRAFTGRSGRGLVSRLASELAGRDSEFLPFPLQSAFLAPLRAAALEQGKTDLLLFWSGQGASLVHHSNVAALMKSLINEAGADIMKNK